MSRSQVSHACLGLAVALVCACQPNRTSTQSPEPTSGPDSPAELALERVRVERHLAFLADDARQGRAPGTAADEAVQTYIETAMREAGLEPGNAGSFRQRFEITDGVRVRSGGQTLLELPKLEIPHSLLPFSADSGDRAAVGRLVYVGHGVARGAVGTGDYKGIADKVQGKIVVALAGAPDDPHLTAADTRPQSKLIAAADHGAVGFVLWDPNSDVPFPNHGEATGLKVPGVFVGSAGNQALARALVGNKRLAGAESAMPKALGLKPGKTSLKRATIQTNIEPMTLQTANVVGRLAGSGESDRVVVLGAHMDHLGLGTSSSLAPGQRAVHNGADDNASGVAVMLEICRTLGTVARSERPYDVVCIAFGAEEMGLLGSKHYVEQVDVSRRARISAMLNFDMVGRLGPDGLVVAGAGTSSVWGKLIRQHQGELTVRTTEDGYGPSDHGSFYEAGIPVLHFFTGPHEDYHKPSDDLDKVNLQGAADVGTMAMGIVSALMADRLQLDYVKTNRPVARGGGFRVSLGTMPDYGAKVDGVRLAGVRPGGPADKAGMRKGDVIKRLGQREIHNLDDYMAAFAEMTPGDELTAAVERDGALVELKMTPAAPRRPR